MPRAPRLRRARSLQAYWKNGDLVVENFVTRVAVSSVASIIEILSFFEDWEAPGALAKALPQYNPSSVTRALRELVAHSLLVTEGSAAAREDEAVATAWKHWLPHGAFHFATKDAPFASPRQWARMAREFRAVAPQPPLSKSYPSHPRKALPSPAVPPDDFLRVLLARQTHRSYSGASLPLASLSSLLHYTWGAMGMIDSPNFGPLLHKTSPSGGARHPAECYVAALDVDGLSPGLYHYNHVDHVLERLRSGRMRDDVLRLTLGQKHVGNANAVCFMTAVFPRTMYKYRSPRAYRIVSLETGHLAQTFCLVATWLGLAPFTTAAVSDTGIEQALGIDGVNESVLYVAGVGMPKKPNDWRVGAWRPPVSPRARRSRR